MSLKTALEFAKNASEEKVPFRFQFPVHTKKEFEALCEKYGVSMTDMIMGLIQSSIDEDKGITEIDTLNIVNKIERLQTYLKEAKRMLVETTDGLLEDTNGVQYDFNYEIESTELKIKVLENELKKRSNQ